MISFKKVCKSYPGSPEILKDIDLEISEGELVFVTGPSGAGKINFTKAHISVRKTKFWIHHF